MPFAKRGRAIVIGQNRPMSNAAWPRWIERLPPPADGSRRAEGGRRLEGRAAGAGDGRGRDLLVSYVTVVRNGAATLERTLASVRAQRGAAVEHLVVDGLSADGTLDIIRRHDDSIDYFVSEPDRGLYDALNKAIPLASGELICVLNADDWLTPDAARLAAQAHRRAGIGAARLITSAAWAERPEGRTLWLPAPMDAGSWLRCADVCHNGVYASPAAYEASGPYATHLRIAADFRWLMACVDAGVEIVAVDEPTVHYRLGGMSGDTRRHTEECVQVLRERFSFLTDDEAWGLVHAFHVLRPQLEPFMARRPEHLGRFVGQTLRRHLDQPDFVRALALAGLGTLQHPEEATAPRRLSRREKWRRSLLKRWMTLRRMVRR